MFGTACNFLADDLIGVGANLGCQRLLSSPPLELVDIKRKEHYKFSPIDLCGDGGDVINKNMPR